MKAKKSFEVAEFFQDFFIECDDAARFARAQTMRIALMCDLVAYFVCFPCEVDGIETGAVDLAHFVGHRFSPIPEDVEKLVEHDIGFEDGEAPSVRRFPVCLLEYPVPTQQRLRHIVRRDGA